MTNNVWRSVCFVLRCVSLQPGKTNWRMSRGLARGGEKALSRVRAVLLLAILTAFSCNVYSVRVNNLYYASLPVSDQSASVREDALQRGLLKVIDRVSGSSNWRELLSEEEVLANTQRLINQYSYSYLSQPITVGTGDASKTFPLLLKARYSGEALNALLTSYGIPVWGQSRPQVLFWVATESENRRQVVSESKPRDLANNFQKAFRYWGVPGLLPLMDLEDSSNLNVSDLWGLFAEPVEAASSRYDSDAIVMARFYKNVNRWTGSWQLRIKGKIIGQGQLEKPSQLSWTNSLVTRVSALLADTYAVKPGSGETDKIVLVVKGITSFRDYVDVSRLLKGLAPVERALPAQFTAGVVRFELSLNGYPELLEEHLALHETIIPTLVNEPVGETGPLMVYRWQP